MSAKHRSGNSLGKFSKQALTSDINVTPLVDVCLVLLIIFMVVTPLLQKGVPVNLPVSQDPEKTPDTEKQLQISVKADGSVYLGPMVVRKEQLESSMKDVFQKDPAREIAVKGDRLVPYGDVMDVLKAARDAGFENVGLIAQPIKQAQQQGAT
ncbi:MAG: biopolymer transporter ExbD [Acidobacteriota bacterium]